ncbi:unnamed protein product [Lactuca virosa]|uniref:Uncharacterized protein n=1 Tax=Lactuca virosa TaxID=75947 RepID=A0AAU9NCE8_9ASTR|nr:unnamed protein product [Lactuca virosa]
MAKSRKAKRKKKKKTKEPERVVVENSKEARLLGRM